MCGIAGLWDARGEDLEDLAALGRRMRDALRHRGPDDAGLCVERDAGVVLGQRRLSILDLSPEGHQPMESPSRRFVVAFNGEIYNHLALRRDLSDVAWRGTSDTETLCAALDAWGLDRAVERFVGMFAIAVWDRAHRVLHLVRDRLGIKPLAWGRTRDGALLFGSELHALRAHPRFDRSIDHEALAAYFETSCVPAPRTIHRAAKKLLPGTIATFEHPGREPRTRAFWSARDLALAGARHPIEGSDRELLDRVEHSLREAVRLRLLADVPLGAFLSGGIDSSLVVALAQEISPTRVRTFSIGLIDAAYDESSFASAVARHLGTDHTTLTVSGADALAVVPELARIYDEPFADSSQIPTYLVSKLARQHVTVALTGDGGDEVFGGYNRHVWASRLGAVQRVPSVVRGGVARAFERVPSSVWDAAHAKLSPPLPPARLLGDKIHKVARALRAESLPSMHAALRRQWSPSPVLGASLCDPGDDGLDLSPVRDLMLRDLLEYLPDDALTKVDRASMAVALEARVPLLDHRVVELASRLPLRLKIRGGRGKWALRQLLARRVPRAMFERPKTGFSIPLGAWLRGPLRDWAESLLAARDLEDAGLDADRVRGRWRAHVQGSADAGLGLWDVLAYRAWRDATAPVAEGATFVAGTAT